jgi:GNAT superfamily N-acetyltransferase
VAARAKLDVRPLTPARWPDLCALFGAKGACAGCWCMWARLPRAQYERGKGAGNKRRLQALVRSGDPPGLLGYHAGEPVAWCSIAPREQFARLESSRVMKPVDERPVWSIVCLMVRKDLRGRGLSRAMIEGALSWARKNGATIVEAYPTDTRGKRTADVFAWMGLASAYTRTGFVEVARRSRARPILRRMLRENSRSV